LQDFPRLLLEVLHSPSWKWVTAIHYHDRIDIRELGIKAKAPRIAGTLPLKRASMMAARRSAAISVHARTAGMTATRLRQLTDRVDIDWVHSFWITFDLCSHAHTVFADLPV